MRARSTYLERRGRRIACSRYLDRAAARQAIRRQERRIHQQLRPVLGPKNMSNNPFHRDFAAAKETAYEPSDFAEIQLRASRTRRAKRYPHEQDARQRLGRARTHDLELIGTH